MVLDQDGLPPVLGPLSVPQRGETVPVDALADFEPGQCLERGRQVDVGRELADRAPGRNVRAADDQGHMDVGVIGRLLSRCQPVLAHVVAVVGAENEVGVLGHAFGPQFALDTADHVVDGKVGLDPLAVNAGDARLLRGRERLALAQPGRRGDRQGVVGGVLRVLQIRSGVRVPRRRDIRSVRSERGHLEHERLVRRGGRGDERRGPGREHVGQVVVRCVPVIAHFAVLVERVVELPVTVARHIPSVPARRDRVGGGVAVEVLAHQRGAVAGLLQRHRERLRLVAVGVVGLVPAVVTGVGEYPVVVGVLAGEDRRTRRAAQRIDDVVMRERQPGLLQRKHVRHVADQVPGQVVGEDEDEVRPWRVRRVGAAGGTAA